MLKFTTVGKLELALALLILFLPLLALLPELLKFLALRQDISATPHLLFKLSFLSLFLLTLHILKCLEFVFQAILTVLLDLVNDSKALSWWAFLLLAHLVLAALLHAKTHEPELISGKFLTLQDLRYL